MAQGPKYDSCGYLAGAKKHDELTLADGLLLMRIAHQSLKGFAAPPWRRSAPRSRFSISTSNRARSRWLIAIFGLLSLAIQSFVVQTHIHVPAARFISGSLERASIADDPTAKTVTPNPDTAPHDKYPVDGDPANCPLCQEMVQAGLFIAPICIPLLLLFVFIAGVAIFNDMIRVSAASHNWRSRGPPHI